MSVNVSTGVSGGDGSYTYSATGLPAGIEINSATGVISGTFTAASDADTATIKVTDGTGAEKSIEIAVGAVTE